VRERLAEIINREADLSELRVFDLTGCGLSTSEIAGRLHIAVKTVETYRARIKEKLKLKDSCELLRLAISWRNQHH
jgi:DNA-binding NarL/FixJ family response regulator